MTNKCLRKICFKGMSAKSLIAGMVMMAVVFALIFNVSIYALPEPAPSVNSAMIKVRFGTVEQEGFSKRDENGIVRGFDAEYMAKISQYGLMSLEYSFYDNFEELLDALKSGKIDMAAGIARTEEREKYFLYSASPFSVGVLKIVVREDNDDYDYGNVAQIAGMKLGAVAGSVTGSISESWEQEYGDKLHIQEFKTEDELKVAVDNGKIDGMICSVGQFKNYREILEMENTSFYVCMNKKRNDLKKRVDLAMNRILYEDSNYADNLLDKYTTKSATPITISSEEKTYLKENFPDGIINVAVPLYDPPYHTFENGADRGIIPEYYNVLANKINADSYNYRFNFLSYKNVDDMYDAVISGEADLLGYTGMESSDASSLGFILTAAFEDQTLVIVIKPAAEARIASMVLESEIPTTSKDSDEEETALTAQETDIMQIRHYLRSNGLQLNIEPCDSIEDCYSKMDETKFDGLATNLTKATWLVNQHRSGSMQIRTFESNGWGLCGAVTNDKALLATVISKAAINSTEELTSIESLNIEADNDIITVAQRLPMNMLIFLFVLILMVVASVIILVAYISHIRMRRIKDIQLIDSQKKLLNAYRYDLLTGLMNRDTLMLQMSELLDKEERFSVIILDLDNFREINESYSYDYGNRVLKDLASRLKKFCSFNEENRFTARYSGAEFVLVLRGKDVKQTLQIAKNIAGISKKPTIVKGIFKIPGFEDEGEKVWFHTTVGVCYSDGVSNFEEIVRNAGIALADAKKDDEKSLCIYERELKNKLSRLNEIKLALADALENDGFYMMYQPQIELDGMRLSGFEALIRMKRGDISPGQFIPIAESQGYIKQIGRKSTELVIRQIAKWKSEGKKLYPVSINYSSNQLADTGYVDYILKLCSDYNVDISLLEIEITEGLLFKHDNQTSKFFEDLQQANIKLLLDDFGTGYSSLRYLTYIPVDYVKLDKSIVDACLNKPKSKDDTMSNAFIGDIIRLTHDIGKKIIVEGVEEEWQVKLLKEFNCDKIQGYYFSTPLLPSDAINFNLKLN